jgi:hypothetical protein
VLGLRLMLTQHSAALHALNSSISGFAPADHFAGTTGLITPPASGPGPAGGAPGSMIERAAPLRRLLQHVADDVRAFCVEKNSAAPDVEVLGGEGVELPLVVPYFNFMMSEVMKNATQVRGLGGGGVW